MQNRQQRKLSDELHDCGVTARHVANAQCFTSQVGNFLSDRPSSRVLAPPGGASQVFLGSSDTLHQPGQVRPPGSSLPE